MDDLPGDEFLEDARRRLERAGVDEAGWDRTLRHAGLHVERQRIEPEAPPALVPLGAAIVAYVFEREPRSIELPEGVVIHDEEGLVAAAKPPWLTTQGSRASRLSSLERALRRLLDCPELRPCNRIDRETSGVVLFARTSAAASRVGRQLQRRTVEKRYLAVGFRGSACTEAGEWECAEPLVRVPHSSHSLFDVASPGTEGAREACTAFRIVEARGERALLDVRPLTGRTHQIRVHATASGWPLVGDTLYGRGWGPGEPPWSAARLQLHAQAVRLRDARGELLELEAPPPADFGLEAT